MDEILRVDLPTAGTVGASFGGAIFAQATQSPQVTAGMLILAMIGLASMVVRYLQTQLELDSEKHDLRAKLNDSQEQIRILTRRLKTPDPD